MIRPHTVLLLLLATVPPVSCAAAQGLKPPALLEGMAPDASELDVRRTPVVRAVESAADSVVSIYVVVDRRERDLLEGQGSGVIIDENGLVITNWHVVARVAAGARGREIRVRLKDGRSHDARLLSSSPVHDLALLQLAMGADERVKPMVAGDSDSLMVGETVIAIGNPAGNANTVTVGVLSQIGRTITVRTPDGRARTYEGLLQTDAAINQGNSGGALLDITGKLVGINNAMAVGAENIGFAIPVNTVKQVFEDVLLASDNLANVWFGIKVQDRDGRPTITSLTPDSPAARAGLRVGDRVVSVGERTIGSALDYARGIVQARPGERFPLRVERRGRSVTLQPVPMSNAAWEVVRRIGLEFEPITRERDPDLLREATLEFYRDSRRSRVPWLPLALRVSFVHADSPAEAIGFRPGDVVVGLQVNNMFGRRNVMLQSLDDLANQLRSVAGYAIGVIVLRDGEGQYGDIDVRRL